MMMALRPIFLAMALLLVPSVELYKNDSSSLKFEQSRVGLHIQNGEHLRPRSHIWRRKKITRNFRVSGGARVFEELPSHQRNETGSLFSKLASRRKCYNMKYVADKTKYTESFTETSQTLIKSLCKVKGEKKVCYSHGDSVCWCQGELADCSGKLYVPNIAYPPKFPPEIKCLIFQHNNARYLDDSYFANVSDFRVIDFSSNALHTVSKQTFARFNGNLIYLILNSNPLTYSIIRRVMESPPSQRLDLVHVDITSPFPKDFFKPFANITLSELYLDFNFIQQLDLHELSALKKIRYLSARNCSIKEVKSETMPSLEFLYLENNAISTFPITCRKESINEQSLPYETQSLSGNSMFPKLKILRLFNNIIRTFPLHTELCLPKLDVLDMHLNNISTVHSYSLQSLTSLSVLYLDKMKTNTSIIESHAFSSRSLKSLHLTKNNIKFGSENISDLMFHDCPFLVVLHIDYNNFLNASEKYFTNLFANLSQLTTLYMGSSEVTFIPSKGFAHLTKVIRLYLYLNKITTIPSAAFDAMSSLECLYLDENQIATVQPQSFSTETIQRLITIDMNRNNFQCNCDLLWFQTWLIQDGADKFVYYPEGYRCADRPGTMVSEFALSRQACLFSRKTYILFTVCLSILIVCTIAFAIVYRYRWHIRLVLYEWRSTRPTHQQDNADNVTHDVFIVYCNDDSSWVLDELLPRVEDDWGLRAFIHERDFVAGRWIIDNTVLAMNSCQHIMVVLSPRFTVSQWCNMELMLCQSHVIEHDLPSLLVIELEPIEPRQMSPVVSALRSTTTFLEWPEDPRGDDLFWRKLERCVRGMAAPKRQRAV